MSHPDNHAHLPDPFLTIAEISRLLGMDRKTVKKLPGIPIIEFSATKKGCFRSQLDDWKRSITEARRNR